MAWASVHWPTCGKLSKAVEPAAEERFIVAHQRCKIEAQEATAVFLCQAALCSEDVTDIGQNDTQPGPVRAP